MMIRKADFTDIPAIVALINSAYRGDFSKQGWTTEADLIGGLRTDEADMMEILSDPATTFLVWLEHEDQIVACVRLQEKETKLYLGMLTVYPTMQGKNLGKALLQKSEELAHEKGCSAVFMTVISVRTELMAWYNRHGYEFTGEVRPFVANDRFEVLNAPLFFHVLEKRIG